MPDDNVPEPNSEIVFYQAEDGRSRIQVRLEGNTVWLSQRLIGELFQKDVRTINEHLQNIFDESGLAPEGNYPEIPDSSNRGKTRGFSPNRLLQPRCDPRRWLPSQIPPRYPVSALGH